MKNFRELKGLIEAAEAVMGSAPPWGNPPPPIGPPPPIEFPPQEPIRLPPIKNPSSNYSSTQRSYPTGDLASSKQKNNPEVDEPEWVEEFRPGKNVGPYDGYNPYPNIDLPPIFRHGMK